MRSGCFVLADVADLCLGGLARTCGRIETGVYLVSSWFVWCGAVVAGAPPIARRTQEAKPGRRKRAGTIGGISGDHFIQVKAEFGDVFEHEEYAAFQTKFRDFDTMGGSQPPTGR